MSWFYSRGFFRYFWGVSFWAPALRRGLLNFCKILAIFSGWLAGFSGEEKVEII